MKLLIASSELAILIPMPTKDDQYSPEETERRMTDAIRRVFNTAPKPHSDMVCKRKRAKSVGGVRDGEKSP